MSQGWIEELITHLESNCPKFLRASDLIRLGLFRSNAHVAMCLKRGQCPPRIRVGKRKVLYPTVSLCTWLKERIEIIDFEN